MSQSQKSQRSQKSKSQKNESQVDVDTSERWTVEELVKNVVQYIFIVQNKCVPVKKLDIVKHAMNRQGPQFKMVMDEVVESLMDVFGVRLLAFKGINEVVENVSDGTFFMIVSKFKKCALNLGDQVEFDHLGQKHLKVGLLRTVLGCLYMLNREMDETELWNIFEKTEAFELVCPKKEDFRKYLKQEYVDTMYLQRMEIKGVDGSAFRYSWGLRAEMECDKYQLLKSISKQMKKTPFDFRLQLVELMNDDRYSDAIKEDFDRLGDRYQPVSQADREPQQLSVQDAETQELELEDIPDSNRCSVSDSKSVQSQRQNSRKARVSESESDETDSN